MLRLANFLLLATLLFTGLACEVDPNAVAGEGRYSPD